ncbi:hypothetical protein C7437_1011014 [Psychrobacillus insolitus]|uniref:Uncharacterized protein n=1 Tax=Psychrobacillus insolitus TaxID=1461 RepID=A0A2W7MKN9_9BACI|nr:hypothetical protein [Psychrobacillus insolitus]PZX07892.1 hypothetical protein C7437_1011014 [Psychrobacillus insolitus]
MTTIKEVELYLLSKENNLTARRWLKNTAALKRILDGHLSWNEDHTKLNELQMVFPLEVNIDYYLDMPSIIDNDLEPSK